MTRPTNRRELEEAVARAMCPVPLDEMDYWGDADELVPRWTAFLPKARAAIAVIYEALAEPTPEMVDPYPPRQRSDVHAMWKAMLPRSPIALESDDE